MDKRIIVRTKSKLSFAGVVVEKDSSIIKLKLSDNSEIQLLIPKNEIESIISNNKIVEVK